MSLEEHVEALRSKHQALDSQLHSESKRPFPDSATIIRLKREKLRIKDEIVRLNHHYPAA